MKHLNRLLCVSLLASLTLLAACNRAPSAQDTGSGAPTTRVGEQVHDAIDEARKKMATENINVSNRYSNGVRDLPKAEISPRGDLLISGQPIAIDDQQRRLLLNHRANLIAVAEAGMAIGVQGADLGVKAAGEAIKAVFAGNSGQVEENIKAEAEKIKLEAEKIKLEAAKLCGLLPAVRDSQDAAAAVIPEFKPYAVMTQADIDDCQVN